MGESTDSGGGGGNESNNEPRGTVFGVDGRSKTGSTSQDKAIGFTDGQGGKGSNYEALNNATSQQTSAAVAAANAAKAAGAAAAPQGFFWHPVDRLETLALPSVMAKVVRHGLARLT